MRVTREYDVPYHVRVSIDLKINVSRWYAVVVHGTSVAPDIQLREDLLDLPVCLYFALLTNIIVPTPSESLRFFDQLHPNIGSV